MTFTLSPMPQVVVLVMGLELVGSLDDLLIQGMCHTVGNGHHHGLVHLIAKPPGRLWSYGKKFCFQA